MPDIPNLPGVPPLLSYAENNVALLAADAAVAVLSLFLPPIWGIFYFGIPVIFSDNQVSFTFHQDFPVSDYPVEAGSFQSYNKVQLPAEAHCRFSAGGSVFNRQLFLRSIDAVMPAVSQLFDIVTPEGVYLNYTFTRRDFDRDAESAGLVVVDLVLREVLQTATAIFQNTQVPNIAGQAGVGNVAPQTPNQSVSQGFSSLAVQ